MCRQEREPKPRVAHTDRFNSLQTNGETRVRQVATRDELLETLEEAVAGLTENAQRVLMDAGVR